MSVIDTIIGKRPQFDKHVEVRDLLQTFVIKSKSMSPIKQYTPKQQTVIMMYTFGAMAYLSEAIEVPEEENKFSFRNLFTKPKIVARKSQARS